MQLKKITLLMLFIVWQIGLAQSNNDTINRTDANGLKQGWWIVHNDIKKLPDYPPAAKVEEGKYLDNKKIGTWTQYYPNGNIKNEITYTNNIPSGYAKVYYPDGKLQEEGMWEKNRWVGQYKSYHPNGQKFYDFNYNKGGKREGSQTYYHDNGQVMMKGDMAEGKETGVWEERYENGDLKAKKVFNNGELDASKTETFAPKKPLVDTKEDVKPTEKKPDVIIDPKKDKQNEAIGLFSGNGYAKLYNMNKQLSKDGVFKNYKLIDGKDYIYTKDGILIQIAVYKNGVYVGDAPMEEKDK
jgi:antitoxin component YwqK of YwqJK toxin-antitoxin module